MRFGKAEEKKTNYCHCDCTIHRILLNRSTHAAMWSEYYYDTHISTWCRDCFSTPWIREICLVFAGASAEQRAWNESARKQSTYFHSTLVIKTIAIRFKCNYTIRFLTHSAHLNFIAFYDRVAPNHHICHNNNNNNSSNRAAVCSFYCKIHNGNVLSMPCIRIGS